MTVLIVDDSQTFRDRLKRLLEGAPGIRVIGEARDGRAAIEDVESLQPDVILLDIHMPIFDGFHVLRDVKARFGSTTVIVLTSDASSSVRQRCESLRADAVIDKSDAGMDVLPTLQQLVPRAL